jgi:predicted nucleic acid-binding protein
MNIVLNTSPVIFLGKVQCLNDLIQCVDKISVPQQVINELGDEHLPDGIQIQTLSVASSAYVQGALGRLHEGELAAMALAQELSADFVVLDDLLARKKAQQLRLKVIGTVGLLLLMNKRNRLTAEQVWQHLTALTQEHGMYLSPALMATVKQKLFMV